MERQGPKVAKDFNQHVLKAGSFEARFAPGEPMTFLCECGCMGRVAMTVAQYLERGAAMIAGHPAATEPRAVD